MKQILVFFLYTSSLKQRKQKIDFFLNLFAKQQVQFTFSFYDDLEYLISPDLFELHVAGKPLQSFDLVYFRGRKLAKEVMRVSKACEILSLQVINESGGNYTFVDKLYQKMIAFQQKVSFPKTYYSNIQESLVQKYCKAKIILGNTMVVKACNATHGNQNILIHKQSDLESINIEDAMFQEYIVNNFDYRVLVLGNIARSVAKRTRQQNGDHRNNTSLGAVESFFGPNEIDQKIVSIAESMSQALNLKIAGVDCIVDTSGKPYYLETNIAPDLTVKSIEEDAFVEYLSK